MKIPIVLLSNNSYYQKITLRILGTLQKIYSSVSIKGVKIYKKLSSQKLTDIRGFLVD